MAVGFLSQGLNLAITKEQVLGHKLLAREHGSADLRLPPTCNSLLAKAGQGGAHSQLFRLD